MINWRFQCNPFQSNLTAVRYQQEILADFKPQFHDDGLFLEIFDNLIIVRNLVLRFCGLSPAHIFVVLFKKLFIEQL